MIPPSQIYYSILIFIHLIYHHGCTAFQPSLIPSKSLLLPYQVFTLPPFYWLRFNISFGERGHGNCLSLRSRINRVAIFVKINCRHDQFRQLQHQWYSWKLNWHIVKDLFHKYYYKSYHVSFYHFFCYPITFITPLPR